MLESLRSRAVNHKFHYDSVKQTQKWLALHQAYSPSRTDPDCAAIYNRSFEAAVKLLKGRRVEVVGLGCGGGQKDARLLQLLRRAGKEVFYTPCDVSTAMVLVAREATKALVDDRHCFPFVCDLATARDLPTILDEHKRPKTSRIITFFGMLPNFEPSVIMPILARLIRTDDILLMSANLAPGPDYGKGVRKILPLYDNAETRDWLVTFLFDLGVEKRDGTLNFSIEHGEQGLKRVQAVFKFLKPRTFRVEEEGFSFKAGEQIRLFFSYRHTPTLVNQITERSALVLMNAWITKSEEEGVFYCRGGSL